MLLDHLLTQFWLLAAEDGAGSGGDPDNSGGTPPGQNGGDGDDPPPEPKREIPKDWKAMPPDEFKDRIAKERRAGVRELLTALGFDDVDDPDKLAQAQADMKDLLDFARQQQREKLTAEEQVRDDLQTAQDTAQSEQAKRETAEQERDLAQTRLREYILRTAITQAAQGAAHPSDVYDLYARAYAQDKLAEVIKPDVDLFTEDGVFNPDAIDGEAVKAIVDACREDRREWWQGGYRAPGSPSNAGAQPPAGDLSQLEKQREAAHDIYRKT